MILAATACSTQKNSITQVSESTSKKKEQPLAKKVIVEREFERKTDVYLIKSAEVIGQQLHIDVSYSGGCEGHVFELFTDGFLMKSLPPKQSFFLKHYANKDACEGVIEETIVFDLSGTASQGNTLVLLLEKYKGELRMNF